MTKPTAPYPILNYDDKFDVMYVYLKDVATYADQDENNPGLYIKKSEEDDSIAGFIIFEYKHDNISLNNLYEKYGILVA